MRVLGRAPRAISLPFARAFIRHLAPLLTLPTSFLYMRTKRVESQSRMDQTVSLRPALTST